MKQGDIVRFVKSEYNEPDRGVGIVLKINQGGWGAFVFWSNYRDSIGTCTWCHLPWLEIQQ